MYLYTLEAVHSLQCELKQYNNVLGHKTMVAVKYLDIVRVYSLFCSTAQLVHITSNLNLLSIEYWIR